MTKGVKAKDRSPAETKTSGDTESEDKTKTAKKDQPQDNLEEVMIRTGIVTAEQIQDMQQIASQNDKKIEEVLVEEGLITTRDLVRALSIQLRVPLIDLKRHTISPEILNLVPEELARKYNVLPLDVIGDSLALVMGDTMDVETIDNIATAARMRIEPMMGFPDEISGAISRNYGAGGGGEEITVLEPAPEEEEVEEEQILSEEAQAPAMRALNRLILQAVRSRASDIHIEPHKDKLQIRYRVDGVMIDTMSLNLRIHPALISRLKIISGMNIAERRRPQDGQYSVNVDGRYLDIRVACGNTIYG